MLADLGGSRMLEREMKLLEFELGRKPGTLGTLELLFW